MFTFRKSVTALAVASSLGLAMPAMADDSKGFLSGTSVSESGQVLSGVEVTITNTSTGLTRTVSSDQDGNFKFPLLPPGTYDVEAKKEGFSISQQKGLLVGIAGKTSISIQLESGDVERISVTGANVSALDVTSSESQLVVDTDFIARVPVPRDVTSVALLAPGTVAGDEDFGEYGGNFASFGGASVGENAYYVNGINVTNFRNGLGGSELPFDMYQTFEVKTGGYSAEFGRSTGGVVNATTKSGSNETKFGFSAYFEPDSLRAKQPSSAYRTAADAEEAGRDLYRNNTRDKEAEANVTVWGNSALVEDKLFFFGLLSQKNMDSDYVDLSNTFYDREASDTLFAAKVDWYITPDHILELTAWDNSQQIDGTKYFNADGANWGDYYEKRGGKTYGLKYTGIITDNLTISAQYSKVEFNYSNLNVGDNPFGSAPASYDRFTGEEFGQFGLFSPSLQEDTRKAYRFDVDWYVHDDHTLRFGIDYEDMKAIEETRRAGGVAYRFQNCGDDLQLTSVIDPACRVRVEYYQNEGSFQTKSSAYYIEDTWTITDNITARIGLRNETFENYNKADLKFVDVSDQWAPRLGIAWDIRGDGNSKVFANFGRYFLPVATNTNVRLAGDELYTRQVFEVLDVNNYVPTLGDALTGKTVYADGTLKNTAETVNADLDPMYQDEYILGFNQVINDEWNFGVKATYRELGSSLEDVAIDAGFDAYLRSINGDEGACTQCESGFHYYVLTNPGSDVTITTDPDGDGTFYGTETFTIPADMLGYPEAERKYGAVDFTLSRQWDGVWMYNLTYTWSHSWGNNEGYVRSDNDQDDSGLTTAFDQPGLTEGAYGNLPNDRRHAVKMTGAYQLTDNLALGANFNWLQGRPLNAFGYHPTDVFASWYGAETFAKDGQIVPRGTLGRTPNTWNLDLSASYAMDISGVPVTFRADVFNVFNNDKATQLSEVAERYLDSDPDTGRDFGEANPTYGLATSYQAPRYVRFSVQVDF